ncbi:hypothetical protein [Phosphitispora sp. TUW77]|uniref:hypothetical protein n=1 Tax=Phosphitispora sp. TUW77 TaxID=3152361 RepID=UPI003AB2B6C9
MKCANHIEQESKYECELCGKSFCDQCLVNLGSKNYCKECLQNQVGEDTALIKPINRKSRLWSFVFSMVPGAGYMYLGLMKRGLQTMVAFFGSIFVASFIGFEELMSLIAPVLIFYSIFDTQQLVKRINDGISIEDIPFWDIKNIPFNQKWLGYTLIAIGFLALLSNMPINIPFWFKRMLPPVIIIGLGVAILYRNTRE